MLYEVILILITKYPIFQLIALFKSNKLEYRILCTLYYNRV